MILGRLPPEVDVDIPRLRKYQFYKRVFVTLLIAGFFVGLYFYTRRENSQTDSDNRSGGVVANAKRGEPSRESKINETFELIDEAHASRVKISDPLPVKRKWADDRLKIADQLLKKKEDAVAQKHGTIFKLEALQIKASHSDAEQLGLEGAKRELLEFAEANIGHKDNEVAKLALVAIMADNVQSFLSPFNPASFTTAFRSCQRTAERFPDDHEIAQAIYQIGMLTRQVQRQESFSIDFFGLVFDIYSKSETSQCRLVADKSFEQILSPNQSLADLTNRVLEDQLSAKDEMEKRIQFSLKKPELSEEEFKLIFILAEALLRANHRDSVRRAIAFVEANLDENPGNKAAESARLLLSQINTRLDNLDKPFSFVGLQPIDRKDTDSGLSDPKFRLLFYWSPEEQKSRQKLSAVLLLLKDFQDDIEVVAIQTTEGQQSDDATVEQSPSEGRHMKFFKVDPAAAEGKSFLARFPVPEVPYILILDENNMIRGVNPTANMLAGRIRELVQR
jgi:hypothetical protein